jgi:2-polyprenyl-3-methyl-5-hydroxy-6-metoxy-1,4-benzoquinol methylase
MTESLAYQGTELDLFAAARNWKRYWSSRVSPYLGTSVLEVGAGIGSNTRLLCTRAAVKRWVCLEPDADLAGQLMRDMQDDLARMCSVTRGTLDDIASGITFDTILYIDVLEHIADDACELAAAARLLEPGGHIVVLAPAHNRLMSNFDRAVGHHRRYDKSTLARLTPSALALVRMEYLDTVGLAASGANALLLRQNMPTVRQIRLWDRLMIPISRIIDPLSGFRFGKSILAVWRRD